MVMDRINTILLGLLLSLSVFAQGMYAEGGRFNAVIFIFFAVVGILFAVSLIKGNISVKPTSVMDWFVIASVFVYAVSSFTAVSLWDALFCLSRYVCCFMLYFYAKSVLGKNTTVFYRILFYSYSIISVYGFFMFFSGSGLDYKQGLMLSVFRYHNATAIFSAAILFLGLYIATEARFVEKIIVSLCNTLLLSTIIYTQSRGTWLIFAIAIIVYLISIRKKPAFSSVVSMMAASSVAVVLTMSGVLGAFSVENGFYVCESPLIGVLFTVLSLIISVGCTMVIFKAGEQKIFSPRNVMFLIPVVLLVMVIFLVFLAPSSITQRIQDFSFDSSTFSERSMFMRDSFSIFKDNPIFGVGGDGWKYVYPSVQRQHYTVAHPHSYFAEMMTDAGIFGILLYVLMLVAFVCAVIKNKSSDKLVAKIIGFMLIFHSFLDFDTDFFTILSLLFVIFAIIASGEEKKSSGKYFVIIPVVLVAWTVVNLFAISSYNGATTAASSGNSTPMQVYELSKRAVTLMPINSDYLTIHGNVCRQLGKGNGAYRQEAISVLEKANRLNSCHYETINQLAHSYFEDGDYIKACDTIKQLAYSQPFIQKSYDYITDVFDSVTQLSVTSGDLKYADYAVDMLMESYEYGHSVSSRCRARIEMGTPMHEAYSMCLDYKKSRATR